MRRATRTGKDANTFWFHLTTIGKHTYATVYIGDPNKDGFADFREPGAFEKWQKGVDRKYFVYRYTLDGDSLVVDGGSDAAFKALMADEKVAKDGDYFKTPAGWLARYLEKTGPDKVYDGTNVERRKRVK